MTAATPTPAGMLADIEASDWSAALRQRAAELRPHGDAPRWQRAVDSLPRGAASVLDWRAGTIRIGAADEADAATKQRVGAALMALLPWRKGPFSALGIDLDAEWLSNLKWARLAGALDLHGAEVLDVGCGNGYYALRMLGAGARRVTGIDPSALAMAQFGALSRLMARPPRCTLLPLALEDMPERLPRFDWVFSMGVLSHCRDPLRHLASLHGKLRAGGRLALETLCLDRADETTLVPPGRYAGMRNAWFVPSCGRLLAWLRHSGFREAALLDVSATTVREQRRTAWSPGHSLADFLDASDPARTVEGHPAPRRAVLTARA